MNTSSGDLQHLPVQPVDVHDLPPADIFDPVIEAYKKDVDRTLLRENLKLTVEERLRKYQSFLDSRDTWRLAGATGSSHDRREDTASS